jgi:hypothetical protein
MYNMRSCNFLKIIFFILSVCVFFNNIFTCPVGVNFTNQGDCFKYSDFNSYCCFIYDGLYPDVGMCLPQKIQYMTNKKVDYNGTTYLMKCLMDDVSGCGEMNPTKSSQCKLHSSDTDSCCWFTYQNIAGCFRYGGKFKGKMTEGDVYISCNGNWVRINLFLFFVIFFLF